MAGVRAAFGRPLCSKDSFKKYQQNISGIPLSMLQSGNWAKCYNAPDMPPTNPWWSVENTIVLPGGKYFGWMLGAKSELEIKEELMKACNKGVKSLKN